jgi:hypothetical protein
MQIRKIHALQQTKFANAFVVLRLTFVPSSIPKTGGILKIANTVRNRLVITFNIKKYTGAM